MLSEEELPGFLPSRRLEVLSGAIGHRLVEVKRQLMRDVAGFLASSRFAEADFFSHSSGPVELDFEGGVTHVLDVWGEQLSIVVQTEPLVVDETWREVGERVYRLSETESAPPALRACLGRSCEDVRIWTLKEEIESAEAREVAVSYLLAGGTELFYCIYLHGDLDADYLLLGSEVPREQVAACYSVAQGARVDTGA